MLLQFSATERITECLQDLSHLEPVRSACSPHPGLFWGQALVVLLPNKGPAVMAPAGWLAVTSSSGSSKTTGCRCIRTRILHRPPMLTPTRALLCPEEKEDPGSWVARKSTCLTDILARLGPSFQELTAESVR